MNYIQSLKTSINKVLLNMGENVTLDKAEKSREFISFRANIKKAIRKQVEEIAGDQFFLDQLINLTTKAEVNNLIVTFMDKKWVALKSVYDSLKGEGAFDEFYIWSGNQGGQAALDKMEINASFNLENEEVTRFLLNRGNLLVQSADSTTKDQIARIIERGRKDLLTNSEIAKVIRTEMKDMSIARSEMIAHTELANATNSVELTAMKRNGVKEIRWVTSIDERVCPICSPLHNKVVAIEGSFSSINFQGQKPPAHPNCRCYLEEVITGVSVRNNVPVWTGQ